MHSGCSGTEFGRGKLIDSIGPPPPRPLVHAAFVFPSNSEVRGEGAQSRHYPVAEHCRSPERQSPRHTVETPQPQDEGVSRTGVVPIRNAGKDAERRKTLVSRPGTVVS